MLAVVFFLLYKIFNCANQKNNNNQKTYKTFQGTWGRKFSIVLIKKKKKFNQKTYKTFQGTWSRKYSSTTKTSHTYWETKAWILVRARHQNLGGGRIGQLHVPCNRTQQLFLPCT